MYRYIPFINMKIKHSFVEKHVVSYLPTIVDIVTYHHTETMECGKWLGIITYARVVVRDMCSFCYLSIIRLLSLRPGLARHTVSQNKSAGCIRIRNRTYRAQPRTGQGCLPTYPTHPAAVSAPYPYWLYVWYMAAFGHAFMVYLWMFDWRYNIDRYARVRTHPSHYM